MAPEEWSHPGACLYREDRPAAGAPRKDALKVSDAARQAGVAAIDSAPGGTQPRSGTMKPRGGYGVFRHSATACFISSSVKGLASAFIAPTRWAMGR